MIEGGPEINPGLVTVRHWFVCDLDNLVVCRRWNRLPACLNCFDHVVNLISDV